MSKNVLVWNQVNPIIKQQIKSYYGQIWNDEVISFAQENTKNQEAIKQAFDLSKSMYKQKNINFGFVRMEWEEHPEKDDTSLVLIQAGMIDDSDQEATSFIVHHVVRCERLGLIPIFSIHADPKKESKNGIVIFYKDDSGCRQSLIVDKIDFGCIATYIDPSLFDEIKKRDTSRAEAVKNQKTLEIKKEDEIYDWLRLQGVTVERQVKTSSNHVVDLWIPDKMIIEIKRGSISANDVCQCIDYASEYRIPIILIGDKVTGKASRGLHGFNKLCPNHKISFVSWDIVYDFLKGKLIN